MSDPLKFSDSFGDETSEGRLAELLGEYIDRANAGEFVDRNVITSEHPEEAPTLISELRNLHLLEEADVPPAALGTFGDYTLRRQIGRGGMGVVYEAWQNSLDRQVALKVLPAGVAADAKSSTRFLREAQIAAQLSHPQIVGVFGSGVEAHTPYYAMEYVEGETLAKILSKLKETDPETETAFGPKDQGDYFIRLARAFADVTDGLRHAHSKGVIHRDVKPSNLILDGDGKLRILDFGLARLEGQESLTLSGDLMGTVLYMSPEQAMAKRIPLDHRTDIYSLGATMYEVLTGEPPFRGKDQHDTLSQIIVRDPRPPRQLNTRVPPDLETIVLKCLRKDSTERYGTAEALAQDLRRFVRGDAIEARPEAALERLTRRLRRLRKTLAVAATLVLLLAYAGWQVHERSRLEAERIRDDYERTVSSAVNQIGQVVFTLRPGTGRTRDMTVNFGQGARAPVTGAELRRFWGMARSASVKAAIDELERIAQTLPEKRDAHYHLARAYAVMEDHEDAKKEIRETLRCDPGFVPALVLRWELTGREEAVFDEMRAACETDASPAWQGHWLDAYKWSSEAVAEGGPSNESKRMWREAAAVYERLLEVTGTEEPYIGFALEVAMGRGLALLEAGEADLARDAFVEAKKVVPSSFEAVLLYGKACWCDGKRQRATDVLTELYQRAEPEEKDEAALLIAAVYRSLEEPGQALFWVKRVDESPLKQRLMAFFLFRLGQRESAIEAGRRAVAGDPEDPIAHMVLAWALREEVFSNEHPGELRSEFIRVARKAAELAPAHYLARGLRETAEALERDRKTLGRTEKGRAPGFFDPPMRVPFSNGIDQSGEITADGLEFYFGVSGCELDICRVTRPSRDAPWGERQPVEEVNTCDLEAGPMVSPDGLELYFIRRIKRRPASIHVSTRASRDAPWSEPRRLEIDSDVRDIPGSLSSDGLTFYFASDRLVDAHGVTNLGGTDLFYATRPAVRDAQGNRVPFLAETVTNLREINTGLDEVAPRISPDGRVLFWSSLDGIYHGTGPRPGGEGHSDIWIAIRANRDEPFRRSTIMNLGWPVNTVEHDFVLSLSGDWPASGSKLYLLRGTNDLDSYVYEATWHPDCNANGIDDQDDLASGVSVDKDGDGRPDDCGCPELDFEASRELWTARRTAEGRTVPVFEKGMSYEVRVDLSPVAELPESEECQTPRELTVIETIEVDREHADGWIVGKVSHGGTALGSTVTWKLKVDQDGRFPRTLSYTLTAGGGAQVIFSGEMRAPGRFAVRTQGEALAWSPRPISDFASIQRWLILGPFTHACPRQGGAEKVGCGRPGEDRLRLDYLTDGVLTEATIRPREGDTIEPDYGRSAASTGLAPSLPGRNAEDLPTWIAWYDLDDEDDRIDFEPVYGHVDNVMCYAVTYLDVLEDIEVRLGVSSDDSIQVLLDGVEIHLNNVARGGTKREYNDILGPVSLEGGRRHILMVKVFDGRGDHNFRVGFVDDRGRPLDRGTTPSLESVQEVIKVTLEPPP